MKIVKLENAGDVVRLACEGEVTQQSLASGRDELREVLGPDGFKSPVLLSLASATYLDSSGISWLVIAHKHCVQAGGRLVIHSVPPLIDQVLRLLRMHTVLHLAANENAARALFLT